jgi:high-affinity Fe2+/Pb2+ permease
VWFKKEAEFNERNLLMSLYFAGNSDDENDEETIFSTSSDPNPRKGWNSRRIASDYYC